MNSTMWRSPWEMIPCGKAWRYGLLGGISGREQAVANQASSHATEDNKDFRYQFRVPPFH